MRINILYGTALAICFWSCSNEPISQAEITQDIEETAVSETPDVQVLEAVGESDDFMRFSADLTSYFQERSRWSELSRGNIVLTTAVGKTYIFDTEEGNYLFIETKAEDTEVTVSAATGRARFRTSTDEPTAYITDTELNRLYSNECHPNKKGRLHGNVVSSFREITYDFGTAYFPTGPYHTADVLTVNTTVDNAQITFDDNNNIIDCGSATEEKRVRVQLVKRSHNNQFQEPIMKVNID